MLHLRPDTYMHVHTSPNLVCLHVNTDNDNKFQQPGQDSGFHICRMDPSWFSLFFIQINNWKSINFQSNET